MKKILSLLAVNSFAIAHSSNPYACDYHASSRAATCGLAGCYTAPVYSLECDWGIYLTGDFLYWFGKDSNLICYYETEGTRVAALEETLLAPTFFNLPTKSKRFAERWRPAFRVGLGSNWSCDGWDTLVNWTYFCTKKTNKKSVTPLTLGVAEKALISPWTNPLFGMDLATDSVGTDFLGFVPLYTRIQSRWRERLNIIDFEIGRNYWLSKLLAMRPYLGARGAWDRNSFRSKNILDVNTGIFSTDTVHFRNKFKGVGILAGFKPSFSFCNGFGFFGNIDAALLWGKYHNKRRENVVSPLLSLANNPLVIPQMIDKFSSFQPILDLAAGLRFESNFCCNRYYFAINIAWEQHYWFNHFCHYKIEEGVGGFSRHSGLTEFNFINAAFDEVYGNFIFGGLTAGIRLDF